MSDKIHQFPGHSLSEEEIEDHEVLSIFDQLHGEYRWDTGIAIGTYLAGLKQGVLLGAHCTHCHKTIIPPRLVCEWCYRPIDSYVPLKDTGKVNTFSLCYVTWDVQRVTQPEIPAVIEIDGASLLHGIMHKLGEVDPKDVTIGMHVQAVWKPAEERTGAITDILYFKPKEGD